MGLNAENLDVDLAAIIYKEANKIIEVETSLRKSIKELVSLYLILITNLLLLTPGNHKFGI